MAFWPRSIFEPRHRLAVVALEEQSQSFDGRLAGQTLNVTIGEKDEVGTAKKGKRRRPPTVQGEIENGDLGA
jgi:hypothetical protein